MISLTRVTYRYPRRTVPAITDIDLQIEPGEKICLLGGNGSGKSTLAKLIAGLIEPDDGSITIQKNDSNRTDNIALLFQNPDNQMVATLVEKDVAFNLENDAILPDKMFIQIPAQLESFCISALARQPIMTLSGGEKQKVALAGVMIDSPELLILDEPDAFLDSGAKEQLNSELERLRTIRKELIEIRLSPKLLVAADYYRVLLLHEGSLIYDGPPAILLDDQPTLRRCGLIPTESSKINSTSPAVDQKGSNISLGFEQLSFAYDDKPKIIHEADLTIQSGEIVGLVGPTGSGKSTIGLLLCGLLQPQSGSVFFCSKSKGEVDPQERRGQVAGTFQQPERQFFLESCKEEILFGPINLGMRMLESEIASIMATVDLPYDQFSSRSPFSLSTGELRRLALACLLSMSPSFLIFDEPTASLDPEGEWRFVRLMKTLQLEGKGMLLISHDLELIKKLSGRIYSIDRRKKLIEINGA